MQTVLAYEESRDALQRRDSVWVSGAIAVAHFVQSRALRSWLLQQRLELGKGLFANVGSRWLAHARRGGGGRLFPTVDLSWSPEAILAGAELRVRAAYAEGAGEDAAAAARLARVPYFFASSSVGRERSREAEFGIDLTVGHRLSLDATSFIQRTPNLLALEASPFGGFPSLYHPVEGRLENHGVELRASGELVESDAFRWRSALTFAALRNRVIRIGELPLRDGYVETAAGGPFGALVAQPFTWNRAQDQDTLPKPGEFVVGIERVVGTVLPTRQAALRSEFDVRPLGVTLAVALERLSGHRLVNTVAEAQCERRGTCAALQAQAPLADRVRAVAARHTSAENTFHESGAYTRLDELAIRWRLPVRWAESLGSVATLSLEGRNLVTWTSFRGLDPEVATARALTDASTQIGQPLPRTLSLRLDVSPRSR